MLKIRKFKIVFACCALVALSACGYVDKKLHHNKTKTVKKAQVLMPKEIEGLSMYGTLLAGDLNSGEPIDPKKPPKFKLDFLPKNRFDAYDERLTKVTGNRFVATGFYQYYPQENNQALLILNGYDESNHINFFLNFKLSFKHKNKGTFNAKTHGAVQKVAPYSQSGTFVIHSY